MTIGILGGGISGLSLAYFLGSDYEILEKLEAGLELLGREVKSLRNKQGSLAGSRAIIRGGEAYLIGMTITPYQIKNNVYCRTCATPSVAQIIKVITFDAIA